MARIRFKAVPETTSDSHNEHLELEITPEGEDLLKALLTDAVKDVLEPLLKPRVAFTSDFATEARDPPPLKG